MRRIAVPFIPLLSALLPACTTTAPAPENLGDVFQRVNGSVALIRTVQQEAPILPGGETLTVGGTGSGVLISRDGLVVTAAHVVQAADEVEVVFPEDRKWIARVVGSDPSADVALLQLPVAPPETVPVARFGDSDAVRVGDRVFVVGAPLGVSHTMTVGYISGRRNKSILFQGVEAEFLQTDAAINPGNSGGPMFNQAGEIIGIVSHILSRSGGSEGLGFAVTSNLTEKLLLRRAAFWSGVTALPVAGRIQEILNSPRPGLLVQKVAKNSPAERLGLRPSDIRVSIAGEEILIGGDIVLEVVGVPLSPHFSRKEVNRRLEELGPEDLVTVAVLRGGQVRELSGTRRRIFPEG